MKRLVTLFSFLLLAFLFLTPGIFYKNIAEAAIVDPSHLRAAASCAPSSTIEFKWYVVITDSGTNWSQYFWKTGDASETKMTYADNRDLTGGGYAWKEILSNLPSGTTYNWYIRVHDDGFCLVDCDRKISGPQVTSSTCNTTLPTCVYTYSAWSGCINGVQNRTVVTKTPSTCNGDPILTQGCTPQKIYNCANRDPKCADTTIYTTCADFAWSANWECKVPPDCAMSNQTGSDTTKWTNSCAYNKDRPAETCLPGGSTSCTVAGGPAQGDCCNGFICDPPGPNVNALADGTCIASPDSLGGQCITCLPGTSWSTDKNSCVNSSGTPVAPASGTYCSINQNCIQGTGCQVVNVTAAPTLSPVEYGGAFSDTAGIYGCGNASNSVWGLKCVFPVAANIIFWLLSFSGVTAVIFIIIGGISLLTSNGDPKSIVNARRTIEFAVVGLIIIFLSFFILGFIAQTTGVACLDPQKTLSFTTCKP